MPKKNFFFPFPSRRALFCGAALFVLLAGAGAAPAACPTGQISLFLPSPGGSQVEQAYSPLPGPWNEAFHSTLTLVPKPGRGGSHAVFALKNEKGDGCFLAGVQTPSLFFAAETADRMYTENTLSPPVFIASAPNALWVDEKSPLANLADFLRLARESEKTGVFPAVSGVGSYTDQHLATLQLNRAAGVTTVYLPVLGSREAAREVLEGRATACWGYALSGDPMPGLRALAVAGETRSLVRPGTPTFREQGIELVNAPCFGLGLIAAAPERIRKELAEYLAALMANPAVRERFLALGFTPLDPAGAAGTAGFFAEQRDFAVKALEDYPLIPKDQRRKPTGRTIAPASGPAP